MWSILQAKDILDIALRLKGFPKEHDLELLSFNKSATYLVPSEGLVVRISRPDASAEGVRLGLELADWLQRNNFPTLKPFPGITLEPLSVYGSAVSFWVWEETFIGEKDPAACGALLRDFHDLVKDYPGPTAPWRPLVDAARHLRLLEDKPSLLEEDREMLWRWQYYLEERLRASQSDLGVATIHGNAHPGSFLKTRKGIVLSDFDFVSHGPREWDLAPWGLGPRRYGKRRESFLDFEKGYGQEILTWPGLADFLFAREFLLTTFRLLCDVGESLSPEARKRLAYWKQEDRSSLWV